MPSTTNVSPPAGTTTIDSDLRIEVEILAVSAMRRIASDIARRIEGLIRDQNPRPRIVIIREDHLDDMIKSRVLLSRLKYLENAIRALLPKDRVAADEAQLVTQIQSVSGIAQAAADLLAFFRADTEYKGRTVSLDETALHPAIGGQLLALGIEAALPNGVSLAEEDPILKQLKSVLSLRADLASLEVTGDKKAQVDAVIRAVDSLMETIAKRDGEYQLPRLSTACKLGVLLEEKKPSPLVLTAKVLTAGGKYKIRKHLFTTLFWGDQLSYGGGATVAFSLFHPDTGKAVLSDVLFHLTHGVKFSDQTGTDSLASNLLTSEASGTLPLVLSQPRRSITTAHQADEQVSPNGDDAPGEWRERQLPAASRVASS